MSVELAKETRGFETEVKQLLQLMIHSLYSNKEIFLRELISNASDATDKLRYAGLANPELYGQDSELKIQVEYNKDEKTITIRDNGIGMSKEEVIQNLGTIAKSGTQEFLKNLTGDQAKDRHLIGQFGVGFYSSFIVAEKVTVNTRRADLSPIEGVQWESTGEGSYTLENTELAQRGTEIILHLKPEEEEFLNGMRLRHIITKYSDHISLPIYMPIEQAAPQTPEAADKGETEEAEEAEEIAGEEVINRATALWTLPKSEIEADQYKEFYKHIAHDYEDPLVWTHNKVEGKLEYTSLLYIPAKAPFDLWHANKSRGLKLYVQRVFIMDDVEQFLPHYLRFVRGIIDCNDLPLNISREILQNNRVIDSIRGALVKKILGTLSNLATQEPEQYAQFWQEFGQALKEGPAEDFANKEAIAKLFRFASTHTDQALQTVSLEDYVARMPAEQSKIYYVAAESFNAAKNSPHLEIFRKKGIEVVLLYDRVDEWTINHLEVFAGKNFQSVAKGSLDDLDFKKTEDTQAQDDSSESTKAEQEAQEEAFAETVKSMQTLLGEKVKTVRLTQRLTDSPSCLVADEGQMTSQMERILRSAGQMVASKPILELNPKHSLIQRLQQEAPETENFKVLSHILLDQAILAEGGQLDDPATFIKRFNELLLPQAS